MCFRRLLLGFGALLLAAQSNAQITAEAAGRIIFSLGAVTILHADGTSSRAAPRGMIHVGDTLTAGEDGVLQVRFIDSAIALLKCNSTLQVINYQYADANSDSVELYLKHGTLRTITGSIQRSNYQFRTDIAVVKPIGTDFEVAVVSPSKAFFGVYDGGITITNASGELTLGTGSEFYFASADDLAPPAGLISQPPAFGATALLQVQPGC